MFRSTQNTLLDAGIFVGDRYRVFRLIARGGFGDVYEVEDSQSGETMALKWVPLQRGRTLSPRQLHAKQRLNAISKVREFSLCTMPMPLIRAEVATSLRKLLPMDPRQVGS